MRCSTMAMVVFAMVACAVSSGSSEEETAESEANGPAVWQVLVHAPGPAWKPGVPFREQAGIMDHVAYMSTFMEEGSLVLGGPFLDDSGGMMVFRGKSAEEAERIAREDPSVARGLLEVSVKPWMVVMRTLE